jgi:hypothetical protein
VNDLSPVIRARLPGAERLNGLLRRLLLGLADRTPGRESNNPAGTSYFTHKWLSDRELFRRPEPEIAALVAGIEAETGMHRWPGLEPDARLSVCAMWAIVSRPGMRGVVHSHNGDVSGAYYVDVGEGDAAGGAFTVHAPDGRLVERLFPVAGQLLLFPSSLLHGVEDYRGERPRIVISFNLRPRRG